MDRVRTRQDLVIRDDQFDYDALLDAAGYAGRRRIPLSLLDTGRFALTELEALAEKGCRILTSDEARPRADEWEILAEACRAGGTRLAAFWNGPLPGARSRGGALRPGSRRPPRRGAGPPRLGPDPRPRRGRPRPSRRRGEEGERLFRRLPLRPARRRARRAGRPPAPGSTFRTGKRRTRAGPGGPSRSPGRPRRPARGPSSTSNAASSSRSSRASGTPAPRSSS